MMSKKILSRASLVCGASCFVVAYMLCGCREEKRETAPAPAAPASHMRDPVLRAQLREQAAKRDAIVRAQQTVIRKMEAVAAKYRGDLEAAGKDPEMISLVKRANDIETNLASNRAHSAEMIRASALRTSAAHGKTAGAGAPNAPKGTVSNAAKKNAAPANTLKKEVKQ